MHESGIVRDLMLRVEDETGGDPGKVTFLRFRVGALSGIGSGTLREAVSRYTSEKWASTPTIEIEHDRDPGRPGALGVTLVSIGLEA